MVRGRAIGLFFMGVALGCFNPSDKGGNAGDEESSSSGGGSGGTSGGPGGSPSGGPGGDPSSGETDPPGSGTEESSTGEPPPIPCPGGDGLPDAECVDPEARFCLDGLCVGCNDLDPGICEELDPLLPACHESGACGLCTANSQCASGACRFATGACIPTANVLSVDESAGCGSGAGTEANPFCTLLEATQLVDSQPPGTAWAISLAPGNYTASVSGSPDHPLAVIGPAQGTLPTVESQTLHTFDTGTGELYLSRIIASDDDSAGSAVVQNGGTLRIEDATLLAGETILDLRSGESHIERVLISNDALLGVSVGTNATVVFEEVTIENNAGAMFIDGDVTLRRSMIRNNYVDGGIWVPTGTLRIENSFIHDNLYQRGAIEAEMPANVEILYSTIIDQVECGGAQFTIRNSVVFGLDLCGSADIDNSAVDTGYVNQGAGNFGLAFEDLPDHFVNADAIPRDFHLLPGSPIAALGVWQVTDPTIDFDGDARPEVALASDAAGADVP